MHCRRSVLVTFCCACVVLSGAASENFSAERTPQNADFSIVVIPDTQHYSGKGTKKEPNSSAPVENATFEAWTDWVAANIQRERIVFVSHVGDIVDRNTSDQWAVARRCMDKLHDSVPYGISVGNHDMTSSGDSSLFQSQFSAARFRGFDWYGGCFKANAERPSVSGNNANSFQVFEAGSLKFVAVHLECNAPDDVLAWVDDVLRKHADRRAIVTTHMGLGPLERPTTPSDFFDAAKGRMKWKKCHGGRGNTPQQMWDKCFRKHRNLFMICCGDQSRTQAMRQTSVGDNGNTVFELLSDYGTSGLRVMKFMPRKNLIQVRTWDPIKKRRCESTRIVENRDQHQFTLRYIMDRAKPGGAK